MSDPPAGPDRSTVRATRRGRRVLTALAGVLFLAGAGFFSFPFLTDVYTEQVVQTQLADTFAQPDLRADYVSRDVADGDPLTRIVIDELDVDSLVVSGTSESALRAGAGHYPDTPLPGEDGNVGIAGHRTTYGKPFADLDQLDEGARIRLETPVATHVYEVVAPPDDVNGRRCDGAACWITHPRDWSVIEQRDQRDDSLLTLTTCHPKGSLRERLIVRAELVETSDEVSTR